MKKPGELPQIRILHLSDIHFGSKHNCIHPDSTCSSEGIPNLENLIETDLADPSWAYSLWATSKDDNLSTPLIIACTGDLAERAGNDEFNKAHNLLLKLTSNPLMTKTVSLNNLFIVPGNHDIDFMKTTFEERFQQFCTFYNKLFGNIRDSVPPHKSNALSQIHIRRESKLVVIEINSCQYIEKGTINENRGQVDPASIAKLRNELDGIKTETVDFIKIALVHHHPILIPTLVEPNRGYDAVANSGSLLRLLREHGVHLILHGHKHFPQVFSYDPESAWTNTLDIPQLIVAGGSCGSTDLPDVKNRCNTYNVITVKLSPRANWARVQVITRGLTRIGADGVLDPDQWTWNTLRIFDRTLGPFNTVPKPSFGKRLPHPERTDENEIRRSDYYNLLRFNMPVVEIQPSLMPDQAYEARVWLEPFKEHERHTEYPVKVTWSAGVFFEKKICHRDDSKNFCAYFHYWGPMAIQAELEFDDGIKAYAHVYARYPESKDII